MLRGLLKRRSAVTLATAIPRWRIDVPTSICGVSFDDAWRERCSVQVGDLTLPFTGVAALRANKLATGRPKDRAEVAMLDELSPPA